jgi:hypothetical protein
MFPIHCKKYLVPLVVTTTSPGLMFPFAIGLVVTFSPSGNAGDPVIKPVIDVSLFCSERPIDGTPFGPFLTTGDLLVLEDGIFAFLLSLNWSNPRKADMENVALGFDFLAATRAAFASLSFAFCVSRMVARGLAFDRSFGRGADLLVSCLISLTDLSLKK